MSLELFDNVTTQVATEGLSWLKNHVGTLTEWCPALDIAEVTFAVADVSIQVLTTCDRVKYFSTPSAEELAEMGYL